MMMLLLLLLLCTIDGDGFWLRLAAAADVHGPLSLCVFFDDDDDDDCNFIVLLMLTMCPGPCERLTSPSKRRIVEFEHTVAKTSKKSFESSVLVELWDCSGDPEHEAMWPAMAHEAAGAVLVAPWVTGRDPFSFLFCVF
jgi:hypothetical protein